MAELAPGYVIWIPWRLFHSRFVLYSLLTVTVARVVVGAEEGESSYGDQKLDWKFILGCVCFAIGGVLIIFGIARLIWWGYWDRKYKNDPLRSKYRRKNFNTMYHNDPWLREPSLASIASRHNERPTDAGSDSSDNLRVNEDIYAQPVDATNPKMAYMTSLHYNGATDQEPSQTESQIYGSGAGGSRNGNSPLGRRDDVTDDGVIYSVPDKKSGRRVATSTLDYHPSHNRKATPNLPARDYQDEDLSEADRHRQYSPSTDHVESNWSQGEVGYPKFQVHTHPGSSNRKVTSDRTNTEIRRKQQGRTTGELSGQDLLARDQAVFKFRNSAGEDVPWVSRHSVASSSAPNPAAGSVKSMKSLYQYMLTDEPMGLDREMDYHFVSSYH